MDRPKEKHVTYICGIPLIEKCVFICDGNGQKPRIPRENVGTEHPANSDQQDQFLRLKALLNSNRAVPVIIIILSILMLLLAYCTFQYIAIQNCPEKFHLENTEASLRRLEAKLSEVERALNMTTQQNEELTQSIAGITANKAELTKKLKEAETELSSLKTGLESAKEQENKLQEENENLKSEKDTLTKDLSATKFTLGNCKNKNMDHEVRSLELLQEIEGLKKELKAC